MVFRDYVGDADREHFLAIYLDALDRLIGLNEVAIGTINLLHVTAREIFKPAILCNSTPSSSSTTTRRASLHPAPRTWRSHVGSSSPEC